MKSIIASKFWGIIPIALKVLAEGDSVRILFISSVAILAAVMDIFKTRKTSEQDLSQPFTVLFSFSLSPHSLSSISPHIFRSSFFPLSPLSIHFQVFLLYSHFFPLFAILFQSCPEEHTPLSCFCLLFIQHNLAPRKQTPLAKSLHSPSPSRPIFLWIGQFLGIFQLYFV